MTRTDFTQLRHGSDLIKRGFARMQQGGVIMDVVDAEQAAVAEDAGAVAVMALERVPADIRKAGGVARTSHPDMIQGILDCTSIPVMAKARIGHEGEARILESMGVDMVDESEVLTPADPFFHINKKAYEIPFVCGATELGEAVRRIHEGAAMIRTKGEAGTGNLVAAVTHSRLITQEIKQVQSMDEDLLDERQRLALDGVLSISIVLDDALERTGDIQVENAGLHPERYSAAQADSLRERLIRAVDSMPTSQGPKTPHAIRRVLLKVASSELRKAKLRPIILIQLHH